MVSFIQKVIFIYVWKKFYEKNFCLSILERYRIQTESLTFIYLFADELITRIQEKQPEAKLNCTLPLDQILHEINAYVEVVDSKFHQKLLSKF